MGKLLDWHNSHDTKLSWPVRIALIGGVLLIVAALSIKTCFQKDIESESQTDNNVYLNEEICFAKEIYISVLSINVNKWENTYLLNLEASIEQRSNDGKLDKVKISPDDFVLKSVNLNSRSPISVFFECLFEATLSAALGGGIEGSINIIDETASFIGDYTIEAISNAVGNATFRAKNSSQFEPFYPRDAERATAIPLSFEVKKEQLEKTTNVIVLAIDQWNHWEKHIFLTERPH